MMGASCLLQSYLETAFNIFSGSYVVESGFAISFNARRHHGFSGVRIQPLRANWKRTDWQISQIMVNNRDPANKVSVIPV